MNKSRGNPRLVRLLALVPYLLAHEGASPEEVARAFSVDRKTLEADLDLLWLCGVPPYDPFALIDIDRDDEHIRVSSADYFCRPLALTEAEARSIAAALEVLGEGAPEGAPLATLLAKVRAALHSGKEKGEIRLERPSAGPGVFEALAESIRLQRPVTVKYYSASRDEMAERTIDPYRLISVGGHWYVLAHCHKARDRRLFRLDRVATIAPSGDRFELPEDLDVSAYERGVLYQESPTDKKALVRFSPEAARWAREAWPEYPAETDARGRLTLAIPYVHEESMVPQLLPYGPDATVLEPPELVDALLETAGRLAERYPQRD